MTREEFEALRRAKEAGPALLAALKDIHYGAERTINGECGHIEALVAIHLRAEHAISLAESDGRGVIEIGGVRSLCAINGCQAHAYEEAIEAKDGVITNYRTALGKIARMTRSCQA